MLFFPAVLFQLLAKAQQAKQNAEEAGKLAQSLQTCSLQHVLGELEGWMDYKAFI